MSFGQVDDVKHLELYIPVVTAMQVKLHIYMFRYQVYTVSF